MNSAQKTPLARSLNRFAEQKINDAFQQHGKAFPCSVVSVQGQIVTVKFELNTTYNLPNVTIPIYGAEYIRFPTQKGDKGMCFPADARLDQMSGIGNGVADLTTPGNLTALVFLPIGNKGWTTSDNANAVVIYGPDGVILRDSGKKSTITISPSGIAMKADSITSETTGVTSFKASVVKLGAVASAKGVVQGDCLCAFTGAPHPQVSTTVLGSV